MNNIQGTMNMKKIKLLNKISQVGLDELDRDLYVYGEEMADPDAILVRSAVMHDMTFGDNLLAIARCGAGVNNIPIDACSKKGIVVFNTPGANANGVKELALAALLLASRNISGGIAWADSLKGTTGVAKAVEAGKSAFVGPELKGKTLGVIGLGAIGGLVANAAVSLGMNVVGCDPYLTVDSAWSLSRSIKKASTFDEIYTVSDYITVHVPSTDETRGMFCADSFAKMKDGVRIINLSRADLVNVPDMKEAIANGRVACYVTDFPTDDTVGCEGIITIPHLGASTPESEDNCAKMAVRQLRDYIENGTINNSVNYPKVILERTDKHRIIVLHENIPNIVASISSALSKEGINIENMLNRSRGNNACTVIDTGDDIKDSVIDEIKSLPSILSVRLIKD